jgi:hypothetical protein
MKSLHLGIPPPFIGLIEMSSQYIKLLNVLGISFTTVAYLDKMSELYES